MFDFSQIRGNADILRHLQNAIKNGAVSHAYIFEGPQGTGKKLLANTFAKALQCESPSAPPCLSCVSCRRFENHNHPDIIYVKPAKTKSIGVDDIREQVNRDAEIKPYEYPYKIFLIDAADTMTAAAQNALLKTIEEPAGYGVFLLLATSKDNFLPTILSRCVTFRMHQLSDNLVTAELLARGIDEQTARTAGIYARGNIGRALQLAESDDFKAMRLQILTYMRDLPSMELVQAFSLYDILERYKEQNQIQEALDIIFLWYRDVIVAKDTGDAHFLLQSDYRAEIMREAKSTDFKALFDKLEAVQLAKSHLRQNGSFPLTIEVLLIKMLGAAQNQNKGVNTA